MNADSPSTPPIVTRASAPIIQYGLMIARSEKGLIFIPKQERLPRKNRSIDPSSRPIVTATPYPAAARVPDGRRQSRKIGA